MLKREWAAESNGKLPHLFTHSESATLVPEFAVEDLPLSRTATLVPCICSERPALGQNTVDDKYYFNIGEIGLSGFPEMLVHFRSDENINYLTRNKD